LIVAKKITKEDCDTIEELIKQLKEIEKLGFLNPPDWYYVLENYGLYSK